MNCNVALSVVTVRSNLNFEHTCPCLRVRRGVVLGRSPRASFILGFADFFLDWID